MTRHIHATKEGSARRGAPAMAAIHSTLSEALRRIEVPPETISEVVARARFVRVCTGSFATTPIGQAHFLTAVLRGAVVVRYRIAGRVSVVDFVPPASFLWAPATWRGGGYEETALGDTVVASIGREIFWRAIWDLGPSRAARVMEAWSAPGRRLAEIKCRLLRLPCRERVLWELRRLASDHGRAHPSGREIAIPIRTRDLADLVVASPAAVSRMLTSLRHAGLVDRVDGHLLVTRAGLEGTSTAENGVPQLPIRVA